VKAESDRQRVTVDYLKHTDSAENPEPPTLDCDAEEWTSIEKIAFACEQRKGCEGFNMKDGKPHCLLEKPADASVVKMATSAGTDTYIRVVNKHGLSFEITTGPWSQCSVTCGGGAQTRELFCTSEMGTDSTLERCQGMFSLAGMPPTEQTCNDFGCPCEKDQVIEDNGVQLTNGVTFAYDSQGVLACSAYNQYTTGEVDYHCAEYKVGEMQHVGGGCKHSCKPGDSITSAEAEIKLKEALKHEEQRTEACPVATHTGNVELYCTDGTLSIEKGECFKRCTIASIEGAMEAAADDVTSCVYPEVSDTLYHWEAKTYECPYGSTGEWEIYCDQGVVTAKGGCTPTECSVDSIHSAMNGNGLDIFPTVTEKMLHWEFSKCSQGKQDLACPYGATGDWHVYCDNAAVKATGGCTSTECSVNEIHVALASGHAYPVGSGEVYPMVTEKMYHYEFPKVSKGKETLSCPDRSSGSWEAYCDNGTVHTSGSCEVSLPLFGYMPYQTEPVYGMLKSEKDGKCLDYNYHNQGVYMSGCHGHSNQVWFVDDLGRLRTNYDHGRCLDYDYNSNRLSMYPCHGNDNQRWQFEGDGHIGSKQDDKCLDYKHDGTVFMYECHGDINQKWVHRQRDVVQQAVNHDYEHMVELCDVSGNWETHTSHGIVTIAANAGNPCSGGDTGGHWSYSSTETTMTLSDGTSGEISGSWPKRSIKFSNGVTYDERVQECDVSGLWMATFTSWPEYHYGTVSMVSDKGDSCSGKRKYIDRSWSESTFSVSGTTVTLSTGTTGTISGDAPSRVITWNNGITYKEHHA
jgi:hypothetical protein